MEQNKKPTTHINLFIIVAISIIIFLFVLSIAQIIIIHNKNAKLKKQQQDLDKLNQQVEYYEQHQNNQSDEHYDIEEQK